MTDPITDNGGVIGQLDGNIDNDYESDLDSSSDNVGINLIKNEYAVRLLLTNARSLRPKMDSLCDAFSSLGLNMACITETWYRGGREDVGLKFCTRAGTAGLRVLVEEWRLHLTLARATSKCAP